MNKQFIFLIACCISVKGYSQDIHFSQYWENPVILNPAATGTDKSYLRVSSSYRNQWGSLGNLFSTSALAADMRIGGYKKNSSFGAGTFLVYDRGASGTLSRFSAGGSFSSSVRIGKEKYLALGIQCAFGQNAMDYSRGTWDLQYNNEYDPAAPSGENFSQSQKNFIDAGTGILFYRNGNSRDFNSTNDNSFVFGISAHHINRPDGGITGKDLLNIRYNAFFKMDIVTTPVLSFQPAAYYSRQGTLQEINAGSLVRYSLSEANATGTSVTKSISFGLFYRYGDAIYPVLNYEWKNWLAGISYDMNISNLSSFTKGKGGMEITVRYRSMRRMIRENESRKSF